MRKYLFPLLGVLFLAVLAPMSVDARQAEDAKVDLFYYYPSTDENDNYKLTAAEMAGAQAISVGSTVNVDFRVDDFKVYKLSLTANQVVRFNGAKNGEEQGGVNYYFYNSTGEREGYGYEGSIFYSDKAETYYILAYSNESSVSRFSITDASFRENVTQKANKGTQFAFVPSVTGTYVFNVSNPHYKYASMSIYAVNGEITDYKETEGKYTSSVSANLTAGKTYILSVYSNGKYTLTLTKSAAADAVAAQIARIGSATTSNGAAIDAARAAFNALTPAEQKAVSNAATLTALENQYANLTKPSVAKVKIKKVKAAKKGKKATVTWKKISGAAGYQVTYGTKKSLKKAKTVTVNASKSKAVIRKLKNKKYYVRVRAFKTYRGQTFYGSYSKVKKVTIR